MGGGEKMPLTVERIRQLIEYRPETGLFYWLVNRNSHGGKAKAGAIAGTPSDGYVQIGIDGRHYKAQRLAWLLMTGSFPPKGKVIDHINRDRADNRWANLRLADRTQNCINSGPNPRNTSGVRGVSWSRAKRAWDARISFRGKTILLGTHELIESAIHARKLAEQRYFGEFAPLEKSPCL